MSHPISLPDDFSQNARLPIRIVSPGFGHLPQAAVERFGPSHRLSYYFFLFMLDGTSRQTVDTRDIEVGKHELLFLLPHQIRHIPAAAHAGDYYKLGFDQDCLSRLPRQYPFLLDPLNLQKIHFHPAAADRLRLIFEILEKLLATANTEPELLLAHLNSLLTEINTAYFAGEAEPADDRIDKFIGFKLFVENNLTDQPTIREIAEALAVSQDSLYQIVKQYSGLSPKEFMTNRLMLEARRRLYYGKRTSVKELAFDLGFNDPDYFSRLFKKVTGKTVAGFFTDLS